MKVSSVHVSRITMEMCYHRIMENEIQTAITAKQMRMASVPPMTTISFQILKLFNIWDDLQFFIEVFDSDQLSLGRCALCCFFRVNKNISYISSRMLKMNDLFKEIRSQTEEY